MHNLHGFILAGGSSVGESDSPGERSSGSPAASLISPLTVNISFPGAVRNVCVWLVAWALI